MKLAHLVNPVLSSAHGISVHIGDPNNADRTFCGTEVTKTRLGVKVTMLYPTDMAATCGRCRLTLEVACRERLQMFTMAQLEDFLNSSNGKIRPK